MGVIEEDSRQQRGKHAEKHRWWADHGVTCLERCRALPFGDYVTDGSNIAVDTKRDVRELAMDAGRDHARFRRELERARDAGWRLVVLTENRDGVRSAADLARWVNPTCRRCELAHTGHCHPLDAGRCDMYGLRQRPLSGERFARMIATLSSRYGAVFEFCDPSRSAERICELLGVRYGDG